jgi:hypothetical protein
LKGRKKMTLKQYVELLNKLVEEGHGNKEIVYSSDAEGNNFEYVLYAPAVGVFKDHGGYGEFDAGGKGKVNAVCIN